MSNRFGLDFELKYYEGLGGKSIIKKLMKPKPYKFHCGVKFLKEMNAGRAAANSQSLRIFLENLGIKNCWWLNKRYIPFPIIIGISLRCSGRD